MRHLTCFRFAKNPFYLRMQHNRYMAAENPARGARHEHGGEGHAVTARAQSAPRYEGGANNYDEGAYEARHQSNNYYDGQAQEDVYDNSYETEWQQPPQHERGSFGGRRPIGGRRSRPNRRFQCRGGCGVASSLNNSSLPDFVEGPPPRTSAFQRFTPDNASDRSHSATRRTPQQEVDVRGS